MTTEGYVIARSRKVSDQFFTSSSSYDRPRWIPVSEATVFLSAELAQKAAVKLGVYGAYGACVRSLKEAISFEMPDDKMDQMPAQGAENQTPNADDAVVGDEQEDKHGNPDMVAGEQEQPCEDCDHCPCTCHDQDPDGGDDQVDGEIADHFGDDNESEDDTGSVVDDVDQAVGLQAPDARMEGIDTTVTTIKYKQNAVDQEVSPIGAEANTNLEDKVAVPADVKSALAAAIAQFKKEADDNNEMDDNKATFAMTVHSAFTQLQTDLSSGDTHGLKMAQVHFTSWMSPITQHLPEVVKKFILHGGRKSSLKDLFDTKKTEKKVIAESASEMADRLKYETAIKKVK